MSIAARNKVTSNLSRARMYQLPATLTHDEWTRTLADFHGLCAYCEAAPAAVLEHFVPLSLGGGTTAGNCLPACDACDASKSGKAPEAHLPARRLAALRSYLVARSTGQDTGAPVITEAQINLRAPLPLVERLDAWVEILNTKGHARWTRNAVILALCERALDERGKKGTEP